jgi:hypothetical protein
MAQSQGGQAVSIEEHLRYMAEDPFGPCDKNSLRKFAVEVRKLEDRVKQLEDALRKIANQDYRGNRSTESQIAFEALKP